MIKLDKIKIVSSIKNISNINEDKFQSTVKEGEIVEQKYFIQSPFNLYIEADYKDKELVIECTGKILKDDYPNLINKENIKQCLVNINQLNICTLDVVGILKDGEVVKCDVSQDVECSDCKTLTKSLRASVRNFNKYLARNIGGNFVIEKNVSTKNLKRRLTIYDKWAEMMLATNRDFLSSVENSGAMLDYFANKARFELNLNSKEQIRQSLGIADTSILSVLGSTSTPIWNFLDKAIDDGRSSTHCSSLSEFKNMLLLQHCDKDLAKVEAIVRQYSSPNTHISQAMKPYRDLAAKLSENLSPDVKEQLRSLLLEIVILVGIVSI